MGQSTDSLTAEHVAFIEAQKLFFVGTATADSRVNVSPKGMDSLRVLGERRVIWLNLTGSGNETAAHVQRSPRMTLMFCAFEGRPLILRLYGSARTLQHGEPGWDELVAHFEPLAGSRQIFDLAIERVQTSCGMAVPRYAFLGERRDLETWARRKGPEGLERYWQQKNRRSIDGLPAPIPPVASSGDGPD
ncbi:MAG: pyridoxamine 5'-phosphate oxidase [Cyanobium sp. CACIAM 14]|nr:MAG: pyridoxamine 5'-phosphate oxidase [Cyanobium sp. CACIAM 14]